MRKYPSILRCYIRPEKDHYIAVCLELNLCDRGETLEKAKASLEEDIAGYIESLSPEDLPLLFPRHAPLYTHLDYYRVYFFLLVSRIIWNLKHRWDIFVEPLLLKPSIGHV